MKNICCCHRKKIPKPDPKPKMKLIGTRIIRKRTTSPYLPPPTTIQEEGSEEEKTHTSSSSSLSIPPTSTTKTIDSTFIVRMPPTTPGIFPSTIIDADGNIISTSKLDV